MLHQNIDITEGIHIAHAWEVVDAAARLALVVAADDIGKICWQQDTNDFYVLTAITPVWKLLTITDTDDVTEGGTNLYHTGARVLATVLDGLSTAAGTVVTAAHTVLEAIGFLQAQTANNASAIADNAVAIAANSDAIDALELLSRRIYIPLAISDETTALAVGTAKITFRMPCALTNVEVKASLTTAQTSGTIFTLDVNEEGASILSTKPTIDNTEESSATATTPAVLSDTALADDAEITVDIDQIGDGTAKGCKLVISGIPA